jgi:hypothetical protein
MPDYPGMLVPSLSKKYNSGGHAINESARTTDQRRCAIHGKAWHRPKLDFIHFSRMALQEQVPDYTLCAPYPSDHVINLRRFTPFLRLGPPNTCISEHSSFLTLRSPDEVQFWKAGDKCPEHRFGPIAVLDPRRMYHDNEEQTEDIDDDVALATVRMRLPPS